MRWNKMIWLDTMRTSINKSERGEREKIMTFL
jgi:hypothetical protein